MSTQVAQQEMSLWKEIQMLSGGTVRIHTDGSVREAPLGSISVSENGITIEITGGLFERRDGVQRPTSFEEGEVSYLSFIGHLLPTVSVYGEGESRTVEFRDGKLKVTISYGPQ